MKCTGFTVAPLDHGGGHGLNKCTSFLIKSGDADKPVLSGRRPISILAEEHSEEGLEKDQGR